MATSFDFGYPWWLTSGHAYLFLILAVLLALAWRRRWSRGAVALLAAATLWAGGAALVVYRFGIDRVPPVPTESFLSGGSGRVLDLGAGTGRSSLMVLKARPNVQLVALDLFAQSFDRHFGQEPVRPQDRLEANLRRAGVMDRVTITTADMRHVPFEPATFDAVVSAYAMDHLGRQGARDALTEAYRVLKPGGHCLLVLIENNAWAKFAFGPLLSHGGTYGRAWWTDAAQQAGFTLLEQGELPVTLYLLFSRPTGPRE